MSISKDFRDNQEYKPIEIRSEEVQEIMGQIPHWILRWGISFLFLALLAVLVLAWFIRFPDILTAQLVISTNPPPLRLEAPNSGKIVHFFVEEGESVHTGDWLGVLESPANWRHIQQLEHILSQTETDSLYPKLTLLQDLQLGSLQDGFSALQKALDFKAFFTASKSFRTQTQSLSSQQAAEFQALNQNISEQLIFKQREVALAKKDFEINQKLFEDQAISQMELERMEKEYIRKNMEIKQLSAQVNSNNVQILNYQHALGEKHLQNQENEISLSRQVLESRNQLLAAIAIWEKNYVLKAPGQGSIYYFEAWAQNQEVELGVPIFSLIPDTEQITGRATVNKRGAGKLKAGQSVNIKLDNYDYKQFGMLTGHVDQISPIPQAENYLISISLENGQETTYGKQLDFKVELSGQAEIITEELRLLERIFFEVARMYK